MPHLKELHAKYESKGLVLIGVHTTRGAEKMKAFAEEKKITYPIAADVGEKTVSGFRVDSFPDYYVIDRAGKLRFADLANAEVDRAIELLLKEKAPADQKPVALDAEVVLKRALAQAKAQKRNLLVHLGAPW